MQVSAAWDLLVLAAYMYVYLKQWDKILTRIYKSYFLEYF